MVSKANAFKAEESRGNGEAVYRSLTQGLIWGENFLAKEKKPERFSDMRLRVRFDFPKGWVQDSSNTSLLAIGAAEDKSATLSLQAIARTSQSPEEYLYNYLNVGS